MKNLVLISIISTFLISCSGVKFASAPVNKALPETFTNRAIYPAGVAGYEFQDLVGNILKVDSGKNPIRIGLIRPDSYKSEIIPITDANNYYKSRIQRSAEASGSYLAFSANFSAEKLAELTLIDIARAGIILNDNNTFKEILDSAKVWVETHPKGTNSAKRLWVKSVVLTRRVYNDFTKIEADASGQKSDVVGVSTGVYSKDENSIKSVIIAFEAFDIDELVSSSAALADTKGLVDDMNYEQIFKSSLFTSTIEGEIINE